MEASDKLKCGHAIWPESSTDSQIDHAALVTTMHLSGMLVGEIDSPLSHTSDRHADWLAWAEREERVRLAWFVFAGDVHNATVLRQCSMVSCLVGYKL